MKWLSFSIILFIILSVSNCKPSDPFIHIPISGSTVIDANQKEFPFSKPFKPSKQVNEVCFEHAETLKLEEYSMNPPRFADGTPLLITAYLGDNRNERLELNKITRLVENYLCFVPENYNEWLAISKKDVSFLKLSVQSNRKINVSKIEWRTYNAWDIK